MPPPTPAPAPHSQPKRLSAQDLIAWAASILEAAGSSADEARRVATNLVGANLRGHDSHGVGMVPRYVDAVLEGALVPGARARVTLDAGTLLAVDGQRGYGQTVGEEAIWLAMARARELGSCVMALAHAHHLGRIGHFAELAAEAGLVSLHFVNVLARAIVAPWGGGDGRFGTNPVCIGIPMPPTGERPADGPAPDRPGAPGASGPPAAGAHEGSHFILDFATSRVAQGKMRVAHNEGRAVAPGLLIDGFGRPTTNPGVVVAPPPGEELGALLPFGEHKGSGLAIACELLGGALTGGGTWHQAPASGVAPARAVYNGMLSILIDPRRLGTQAVFAQEAAAFAAWVRASPAAAGHEVLLAGEPERAALARREREGILIDAGTWAELEQAAAKAGAAPSR